MPPAMTPSFEFQVFNERNEPDGEKIHNFRAVGSLWVALQVYEFLGVFFAEKRMDTIPGTDKQAYITLPSAPNASVSFLWLFHEPMSSISCICNCRRKLACE